MLQTPICHQRRALSPKLTVGCLISATLVAGNLAAADFQAGVARTKITPPLPFYLSGYASRTNPAAAVRSDLWVKALALQDKRGGRVVFVTTDLIGLAREVSVTVAERAEKRRGLQRSQLVLNASHTHSGPVVWSNLRAMFDFEPEEKERIQEYTRKLTKDLTALVGLTLADSSLANLSCGHGSASFAINRRKLTPKGFVIGENPDGRVDHDVPVLKVAAPDGQLRAVLFGYACHNTTVPLLEKVDGDYAGAAQRVLEKAHPGLTALFMILCGGNQNPRPRGREELAEQHGKTLANVVEQVLAADMKAVRGPIHTAVQITQLDFGPHTRESFEKELKEMRGSRQRRARFVLEAYDRGQPPRQIPYPVQAVRFQDDFTFLAMGGEVVVDYSLRAKREFSRENLVVAGYCHDVMCYIPSLRVLREGGYEAVGSIAAYGRPGPFAENVEEIMFRSVHDVMKQVGAKPAIAKR